MTLVSSIRAQSQHRHLHLLRVLRGPGRVRRLGVPVTRSVIWDGTPLSWNWTARSRPKFNAGRPRCREQPLGRRTPTAHRLLVSLTHGWCLARLGRGVRDCRSLIGCPLFAVWLTHGLRVPGHRWAGVAQEGIALLEAAVPS